MSFEVFLQCFTRGKPDGVPREPVRALFPVVASESEPDYWSIRYDDRNACHIGVTPLESDPALVESLCVFRPCDDARLWESLLAVMRLGSVALYFPGDSPPLVASEESGEHLPPDMVKAMGKPLVVESGHEIVEIIRRS